MKKLTHKFNIRIFSNVDLMGKGSVNSISDDPFYTYGWFKTLEEHKRLELSQFYISVYYRNNLVAFAPCFFEPLESFTKSKALKALINAGCKFNLLNKQVLICSCPYCFRSRLIVDVNFKNSLIYPLILQKIDEICKERRILFSAFPYVYESDILLQKTLRNSGYLKFLRHDTFYMNICWASFEDYLASRKYGIRKDIRREIRKFNQSGLIIETNPNIPQISKKLSILFANWLKKYKSNLSSFDSSFFADLGIFAGDNIKLFVAKKDCEIIAFCLIFRHKDVADVCMFGTDYSQRTKNDFAYFNLVYYEPIKWAIENNIRKIYYGPTAENVKLRFGCTSEKLSSFIKCHNPFLANMYRAYAKKLAF